MKLTFKTTTVLLFAAIFSIHGLANTDTKQSDEFAGASKQATEMTKNRVKKGKEKNLIFETALFIKCIFQKKKEENPKILFLFFAYIFLGLCNFSSRSFCLPK